MQAKARSDTQLYKESAIKRDTCMQAPTGYHHEQVTHPLNMLLNREHQQLSDEQKVTPSKHPQKK